MADMDTYEDQHGYEGNYLFTTNRDMPESRYGYGGHSELDHQ